MKRAAARTHRQRPVRWKVHLYLRSNLSSGQISALIGVPERTIRGRLRARGMPVRIAGPTPRHGPSEIELIDALYADSPVWRALSRHGIARRPSPGPIWQRFPVPVDVGPELAKDLYVSCGLGLRHVEPITGQPAETVRALLRGQGIKLRPPGGRSPFLRRWRGEPRRINWGRAANRVPADLGASRR